MFLRRVWFRGLIHALVPPTYTSEETLVPSLCLTCITAPRTACSSPGGYAAALDAEPSENIPVADQISPPHTNGGRTRNPSFKQEDIDGVRVTSLSAKAVEMATSKLSVLGTVTPGYLDNEVALTPTDCQISSNAFNEKSVGRVRRDSVDCVEHHAGDGESERGGEGAIQGESSGMFGVWELFSIPNIPQLLLSGFVFAVRYGYYFPDILCKHKITVLLSYKGLFFPGS